MFNRISRDERARVLALGMAADVCGELDADAVLRAAGQFYGFLTGDEPDRIVARRRAALSVVGARDTAA